MFVSAVVYEPVVRVKKRNTHRRRRNLVILSTVGFVIYLVGVPCWSVRQLYVCECVAPYSEYLVWCRGAGPKGRSDRLTVKTNKLAPSRAKSAMCLRLGVKSAI